MHITYCFSDQNLEVLSVGKKRPVTSRSTCFLCIAEHFKNKKKRGGEEKKKMTLLRLPHGHRNYKNSDYYF